MLPEGETKGEPSDKWPLIDVPKNFPGSTKLPGLSEVYIVGTLELAINQYVSEKYGGR